MLNSEALLAYGRGVGAPDGLEDMAGAPFLVARMGAGEGQECGGLVPWEPMAKLVLAFDHLLYTKIILKSALTKTKEQ